IFNVNCTETAYTGTNAARKTFADTCRTKPDTTGCDTAVSDATGAPTIAMCNTNPYATGCDATVFADALTAYCADGANTIFNTNCNSRAGIATARSVAIGECVAALTTDKSDASCTDRVIVAGVAEDTVAGTPAIPAVTVGVCLDDPEHASCASPLFDFARADHMEVCMSNGNAILPSCKTLADAEPCIANPFLASCRTTTVGHTFRNARLARYAFCQGPRATSTELRALCAGVGDEAGITIRDEICAYDGVSAFADRERFDPFSSVCGANANAKIDYCGNGDNRNTQDACKNDAFNTTDAAGCLNNPFAMTCTDDATINAAVKTRITAKRVAYCSEAAEGFDTTLCNVGTGDGVENEICNSQNANANPFANLCTREGVDFADARETFVKACDALSTGTELAGGATCTASIIACNTNAYGADCVDEPAYADERQSVVDLCVAAVASDADTAAANENCVTIAGVGQLTCITTNPYENREAGVGVTALNCADNSNYDTLRNTLETTTCVGSSTDPRCGFLVANVCGTGTDVVG
ncbi:MAG: hypothetical protein K8953_09250, partial [Proteobacteria bacterium]|nr:hypothetical protein [Pseudomonadota bacterium]